MNPVAAPKVLDTFFLEARCRLLDLAAILDRIDRGEGASTVRDDLRMTRIHQALEILERDTDNRAELIQKLFSQEYDPDWNVPIPK